MKRRRPTIDCIAFETLNSERHLTRVSNEEYLNYLRRALWHALTDDQRGIFEKILASDRSRYVACNHISELASDTHETRYRRYKEQLERLALKCVDRLISDTGVPKEKIT